MSDMRVKKWKGILPLLLLAIAIAPVLAQEEEISSPPDMPTLEEVQAGHEEIPDFIPMDFSFRVGVVGDFEQPLETSTGVQTQIKTPLLLLLFAPVT